MKEGRVASLLGMEGGHANENRMPRIEVTIA
jgi:hypothetical protein